MPSPFPGMDPFLEDHQLWPDVHARLIVAMGDALTPLVAPSYYVRIEQRTYIAAAELPPRLRRPDAAVIPTMPEPVPGGGVALLTAVASPATTVTLPAYERVREGYLEIVDTRTHQVVTAIEQLSPTNKLPGQGRREYEAKRQQVLASLTHLVEIDLLRAGQPMEMAPAPAAGYRVLVSREWDRPQAALYAFTLREPLPTLPVPLRRGEPEPLLSLAPLLAGVYDRARYDLSLDYRAAPPEPSLSAEDAAWVDQLLRAEGRCD